jgi:hypothetical protein
VAERRTKWRFQITTSYYGKFGDGVTKQDSL